MKSIYNHLLCALLLLVCTTTAHAQNGSPDLTFSGDGQLGFLDFPNDVLTAQVLQTNGQIFALLSSVNGGQDSFILKLHDDGSYDASFGVNGILTLSNTLLYDGVLSADASEIYLVAIVSQVYSIGSISLDGIISQSWTPLPIDSGFSKILLDQDDNIIIGTGKMINNQNYGIVLKLNDQFDVVTSFGVNGIATTPEYGFSFPLMEIDHNNRIVLATYNNGANMWRFNANGTVDNTFDYTLSMSSVSLPEWILDFAIAPDNRIYVQPNTYAYPNYLFRLDENGSPDPSFGDQGHIVITEDDPNLGAFPDELIMEPDGGLIIMGSAFDNQLNMAGKFLARLDENGVLDVTFQGGPHPIDDNNFDLRINFHTATLQDDGKVLSMDQVSLWQNAQLVEYNVILTRFLDDFAAEVSDKKHIMNETVLYPNPTNDVVNFIFADDNTSSKNISVYNVQGQLVMQQSLKGNRIDISELVDGLYTINVQSENKIEYIKLLKK